MDPNNNLTPGLTPDPTQPTTPTPEPAMPAPEPAAPTPTEQATPVEPVAPDLSAPDLSAPDLTAPNPATDIANMAMDGATPVVATSDPNAADIPPLDNGPVSLAPSAGFEMPEVSTVSATSNGAVDPLNQDPLTEVGTPPVENPTETPAENPAEAPMQNEAGPANPENPGEQTEENATITQEQEPIVAAAPVPGSIGSAKSYADIQRAEAEKAEKATTNQGKKLKLSKNMILIIIIAVVVVIALVVGALLIFGGSSNSNPTPAPTTSYDGEEDEATTSTLSCKRTLTDDEASSFDAASGTWENVFYFKDDVLDGLETNINYNYYDQALANRWKSILDQQYSSSSSSSSSSSDASETEEPATDVDTEEETSSKKTVEQMLRHSISIKDLVVTHKMEVLSEDIEDWLASDAYSDVTYGAETDTPEEEPTRNLDYYKDLQNNLNYTCSISK